MKTLFHILTLRAALYGLALLLAAFGIGNAFVAVFAPARYEVVYKFDVSVSYCAEEDCAFSAYLSLANTGKRLQERVLVEIEGIPAGLGGEGQVLSLDASIRRAGAPVIERQRRNGSLIIVLQNLSPGTLVQIPFNGFLPRMRLPDAEAPRLRVEARGRVIEGDPRSIAVGRWFGQLERNRGAAARRQQV